MTPAQQLRKDIETCELPHAMFQELLTTLRRRVDDALEGFSAKLVRVPGPSGVGKSSLIANLARGYPETKDEGRRHVPVLVVEVPNAATAKLLPKSVLGALGIQVRGSMTAGAMFDQMIQQLRLARTQVIIFDEISHLVDEGSRVPPRAASDWLKALADALNITLILFGIPRLERLFTANEQLRRRSCPAMNFRPYDATDSAEMRAYNACVANYSRLFSAAGYPIEVPPRVLTQQCYLLTGGLIGVLADFMRELANTAANDRPRAMTYADCQRACAQVSHAGSPHRPAFQDSDLNDTSVAPAALKQAFVQVLKSNSGDVPVRRKSGVAE